MCLVLMTISTATRTGWRHGPPHTESCCTELLEHECAVALASRVYTGHGRRDAEEPMSVKHSSHGHAYTGDIIGWPECKNKRRTGPISTLEFEINDWKLKFKVSLMNSLTGKAMSYVILICAVPNVKDNEYPVGEAAKSIEVIILANRTSFRSRQQHVRYPRLVSLLRENEGGPVSRAHRRLQFCHLLLDVDAGYRSDCQAYPQFVIYHNNVHYGALAPIYLLRKVLPVCLLLQKAEFQRLWPLRTKEEMKEGSLLGVQYQQGAGSTAQSMFSSVTCSVCSTPWHYS